jgi:hypothetical protein
MMVKSLELVKKAIIISLWSAISAATFTHKAVADTQEPTILGEERSSTLTTVDELISPESEMNDLETNSMDQVTSVSQLSDVSPTDWAFQALQSLVERYGCIAGYPDGTYRGNRSLTRYEFAAGLNACLDQINKLIASSVADAVTRDDLIVLQKLQEEFAVELASIGGRLGTLEARISELEANQFSTTTKLSGLIFFNLTGIGVGSDVKAEGLDNLAAVRDDFGKPIRRRVDADNSSITMNYLMWLPVVTSFTGKDVLFMNIIAGNGSPPINQYVSAGQMFTGGVPFPVSPGGPETNQVTIRDFFYSFPVGDSLRFTVGPRVNWFLHFDEMAFAPTSMMGLSSYHSVNSGLVGNPARGSGAVVEWYINKNFELHAGYLVENNEFLPGVRPASDPSKGIFSRSNSLSAELTYKPSPKANIRLLYTHMNLPDNGSGQIQQGIPIAGVLDDGPGGRANGGLSGATADVFNLNFDWLVTKNLGLFGRYTYVNSNLDAKYTSDKTVKVQNFQAGLAFPDLGKPGALGILSFVIPMDIISGRKYFVSGSGDGGTQYEIEGHYYFPVTDHIGIVPALYVIGNLNNFSDNPTVFVGHLRTHFNF